MLNIIIVVAKKGNNVFPRLPMSANCDLTIYVRHSSTQNEKFQ